MSDLIFGYTWAQIEAAQQGKVLGELVPVAAKAAKGDICSRRDLGQFELHSEEGLRKMQFFGIIDRLTRAGVISA